MTNGVKALIAFIGGTLVGTVAGYVIASKTLNKKHQDEMDDLREYYTNRINKKENIPVENKKEETFETNDIDRYQTIIQDCGYAGPYKKVYDAGVDVDEITEKQVEEEAKEKAAELAEWKKEIEANPMMRGRVHEKYGTLYFDDPYLQKERPLSKDIRFKECYSYPREYNWTPSPDDFCYTDDPDIPDEGFPEDALWGDTDRPIENWLFFYCGNDEIGYGFRLVSEDDRRVCMKPEALIGPIENLASFLEQTGHAGCYIRNLYAGIDVNVTRQRMLFEDFWKLDEYGQYVDNEDNLVCTDEPWSDDDPMYPFGKPEDFWDIED